MDRFFAFCQVRPARSFLLGFKVLTCSILTLSAIGCASVPREEALKLAGAGQSATTALAAQFAQVNRQARVYPELLAFNSQYDRCVIPASGADRTTCDEYNVDPSTLDVTRKLNGLIEKRINAVNQLGKAYVALEGEAKYEADADLSGAVSGLVGSIDALAVAANLSGQPLAAAATQIPTRLAGWAARARQIERLKSANGIIAQATEKLAAALDVEKSAYEPVLEVALLIVAEK
jgi:hypothetical protein